MSKLVFKEGCFYFIRDFAEEAKALGLPEDAGRAEVEKERFRLWSAERVGLPPDATWFQIVDASVQKGRRDLCRSHGWPEHLSWTEIERRMKTL